MSQDHKGMTPGEWFSYMANLAAQHVDLQHGVDGRKAFARMVFTEAIEKAYTQLDDLSLLVEMYEEEGIDNKSNNLQAKRYVAWHVVKRLDGQKNDVDKVVGYETICQRVAKQVLARLRRDRLNYDDQRFADVKMESWRGDSSTALFNGAWAGWRIEVPFQHVDRLLSFDAQAWDDTVNPAQYVDVSGLSCANLNDPFLGLTDTQRTNCLYVILYEADGVTERARVKAGGTYTIIEMPYIKQTYADLATATADTTTVPAADQAIKITDTGRVYPGDGTSTVEALIAGGLFYLPVTETAGGINAIVQTENKGIQLVDPT